MPNPWDREDGESQLAYACFLTYRDIGYQRNVSDAYRQHYGKPTAKMAGGQFLKYAKDFRWKVRAEAWDAYQETEKTKAELKALAEARAAVRFEVAKERMKTCQEEIAYGRKCIARGEVILGFPLANKTVTQTVIDPASGKVYDLVTNWEGMDARMVALAAKIGETGYGIIHTALDHVEALERNDPVSAELTDRQQQQAMDKAERLWQEWEDRKEQARRHTKHQLMAPPGTDAEEAVS